MQGDSTNSPYSPLLPQPGLTHPTLTLGGRRTITPHIGGGVKSEPGWKSLLMDAISILLQQKLCHCRQEATNATRIIHDNYDQVREGERTGNGEMGCSSLSGQPPPCSNSSIYSTVLMAGLPSSVSAECVGLTSLVNFLVSLSPHYASTVSFSHIRTMFRSEGKHTLFKMGLRQREASQVALVVKNLPANAG